jgi:hypothetical protein
MRNVANGTTLVVTVMAFISINVPRPAHNNGSLAHRAFDRRTPATLVPRNRKRERETYGVGHPLRHAPCGLYSHSQVRLTWRTC